MSIKVNRKLIGLMGMLIGMAFFELCFTGLVHANEFIKVYAVQVASTDRAGKVYQIDSPYPTARMRLLLQWKKPVRIGMALEHGGIVLARKSGRSPLEVIYHAGARNLSDPWKVRVRIAAPSFRRTVISGALTTQYSGGLGPGLTPGTSTGNTAPKNTAICDLAGKWNLHKSGLPNRLYWSFKRDALHDPANHKVNSYRVYEYLHGKGLRTLEGVALQEKATGLVHVLQNNTAHSPNFPDIRYYRLTIKPGCAHMVFTGEQVNTLIGPVRWTSSQASLTKVQKKGLHSNTGRSRGRGVQPKGRSNRANSPHWGSPVNSMQKAPPTSGQGSAKRMPIQRHTLASQSVGVNSSGVSKKTDPVFSATRKNPSHTLQQRNAEPQIAEDGKVHASRIRISVVKFEAIHQTKDTKKDGIGDEIIVASRALWFQKHNRMVLGDFKYKSPTYKGIRTGQSKTINAVLFDRVMGDGNELILVPSLWEEDRGSQPFLDNFVNGHIFESSQSDFGEFEEPTMASSNSDKGHGHEYYWHPTTFKKEYCSEEGKWAWYSAVYHKVHTKGVFHKKNPYVKNVERKMTLPINTTWYLKDGNRKYILYKFHKFSFNRNFIDKISKIDCGLGPGIRKFTLDRTKVVYYRSSMRPRRRMKNKGEYNLYLRFESLPAPGS